jgi:hypothetical protein
MLTKLHKTSSRAFWLFSAVALLTVVPNGIAISRPIDLYLSAGISDPSGELGSGMEVGYHANMKAGFQLEPKTEFLIGVEYHSMPTDHNRLPDVDADFRAIMIGFDLKVNLRVPEDPITPYLVVGGGYANIDFSDTLTQVSSGSTFKADSDSQSYFELGGGFELQRAFLLVRFVNIFTEQADGRFISVGIGYKFPLL